MKLLGISAFYHDSAAALIDDGKILAAAQEERFSRIKNDSGFPLNAIKFCLTRANLSINELDAVVFYDKPLLKFERLLETYYYYAPKGILSFLVAMPVWIREKLFLKKVIKTELEKIEKYNKRKLKLLFPEHHLSHAASAFYPSPFVESAIITIDGVGEWATASICHGKENEIEILKELRFPDSVGLLYSSFTFFLGFTVNSGEYKLMGLAPYGNPKSNIVDEYVGSIKKNIVDIKDDGSVWLNQKYFNYATGLKMIRTAKWEKLFGFKRRKPEDKILQHHCDLALAIQKINDEIIIKMAEEAKRLTNSKYLCMAGGVALNCVSNGKLLQSGIFDNIFVQPAAGDSGGALGAALAAYYIYYNKARTIFPETDTMQGAYLGPEFSDYEIELALKKYKAGYNRLNDFNDLISRVACLISEGNVVGWFQGRMEFGPRALGNRSILGDPRNPEMQKKINMKIKYREGFRPFAPSVLSEECEHYFLLKTDSPYMLFISDIIKERQIKLPENYYNLPLMERLYCLRSDIPSVTHIDMSARIQTVHKETNERYWKLINAFKEKTGYGVLINTSFNVRGEPIVCTPEHAFKCFMRTEIDYLVIGNYLCKKTDQPNWREKEKWNEFFKRD